jgi:hypothetical protein
MTKTVFALTITACVSVLTDLASAQKWHYRDLLKTIEVKSPPAQNSETKPAETSNKDQLIDRQSFRWHMTKDQVAASGPNISPTSTSERRDHNNPEAGVALLKTRHVAQEIPYTAFYWFRDNKLVAVVMKPSDFQHWPKVNTGLEQIYGKPFEDKSRDVSNGQMHCVVKDRTWISERDDTTVKFVAQECNQFQHLTNVYSIRYEPISTTSMAASATPFRQ